MWSEIDDDSDISFALPATETKVIDEHGANTKSRAICEEEEKKTNRTLVFDFESQLRTVAQDIVIDCAIPYKLRSLWNTPTSIAEKAVSQPDPVQTAKTACERALKEVESSLRRNSSAMHFNDLQRETQWRSKFQSKCGSLFTFLKRHSDVFSYYHCIVSLKAERRRVIDDLLQLQELILRADFMSTSSQQ